METHDNDGAGNGNGRHHFVRDGVWSVGVLYGLVIAVNATLVRPEHDGHYDEWHRH